MPSMPGMFRSQTIDVEAGRLALQHHQRGFRAAGGPDLRGSPWSRSIAPARRA